MDKDKEIELLTLRLKNAEQMLAECISRQQNPKRIQAVMVYQFTMKKVFLRSFPSLAKAARSIGVYKEGIITACEKKRAYKGYYWSYSKKCG